MIPNKSSKNGLYTPGRILVVLPTPYGEVTIIIGHRKTTKKEILLSRLWYEKRYRHFIRYHYTLGKKKYEY